MHQFHARFALPWVLGAILAVPGCGVALKPRDQADQVLRPSEVVGLGFTACRPADQAGLAGQHFAALADMDLPGHLRIVYPGQHLPVETEPDRLNAEVDESGTILRVFCG